jgi:hypothetical protein
MKGAWALNASNTPPSMPGSLELGYPKDTGPATIPGAWWYHMVTQEMLNAITQAGLTPSASSLTQLRDAIAIIAKQAVSTGAGVPVRVVDTVGVALSFAQVIDGISPQTGDRILRAVEPANTLNGVYVVDTAGSWVRSDDFPLGGLMTEGTLFSIVEGTNYGDTIWQMSPISGVQATLGTTSISFRNISDSLNAKFSMYLLASAAAVTYAPLTAPTFTGALTLSGYTAGAVPYLNGSKILTSGPELTFNGTDLATTGKLSAAALVPTGTTIPALGAYSPAVNTIAWATNSQRAMSINPQGYVAFGSVSGIYQGQITGAGQGSAALADGGAVGGALLLQDSNQGVGAGGALVFGTSLGAASPFAAIKGLLTDTSTGKVGHIGFGVRVATGDAALTEAMRITSTRNLLVGTGTDTLSATSGNVVISGRFYGNQLVGISAGSGGQVQAIGGASTTWYNAMLRNDGTSAQLMSSSALTTAAGAVDAVANAFRPFSWNLSTGAITIDGTGIGTTFGGQVSLVAPSGADNSTKAVSSAWVNTKLAGYAPATVGTNNIQRSNGTGGLSDVTIGSGLALAGDGTLSVTIAGSSGGTVTSIGVSVPAFLSVSGSPVTGAGTIAIAYSGTPLPVANGGTGATTATGTGSAVLATSPTLITPNLGTPSAAVLTNGTGLPLTTGVTGQLPVANGGTGTTSSTGTGSNVLNTSPTLITPSLGTPSAVVLTNATGLPLSSGVTGTLGVTNGGTGLTTTAANKAIYSSALNTITAGTLPVLAGGTGVTTSTGSGSNVLSISPALVTPDLGTPTAGVLTNTTGYIAGNLIGNLGIINFNSGTGASGSTFWRGDGVWAAPAGGGTVTNTGNLTSNKLVLGNGSTDTKVVAGIGSDGISQISLGTAGTNVGAVVFANATSGTITLQPVTGALATSVLKLPSATDTLVARTTTDTLTNKTINGLNNSITNISLTTGVTGVLPVANGGTGVTTSTGTGDNVLNTSPTLITPILGTPTSGDLSNCTNFPAANLSGLGAGIATWLATPSSSNLRLAMTDETGTGSLVFGTSPTLVTPNLGTPSAVTLTNATGLPLTTGVTGSLPVANGGTGGTTQATARTGLGLGSMAVENTANWVSIAGTETITGVKTFNGACGFGVAGGTVWNIYSKSQSGHPAAVFEAVGASSSGISIIQQPGATRLVLFSYGTVATTFSTVGEITTNGSSTSYNTTSDYRLKSNVVTLTAAAGTTLLKKLRPVTYTWKNSPDVGTDMGFIAHEAQTVVPNAVHGAKDDVDAATGAIKPQSMDYSKVVPVLTAALQDALARIEALEARLHAAGIP